MSITKNSWNTDLDLLWNVLIESQIFEPLFKR